MAKKITDSTPIQNFEDPWGGTYQSGENAGREWGKTHAEVERVIKEKVAEMEGDINNHITDKGVFQDRWSLEAAHPNPKIGWYAAVGPNSQGILYVCSTLGEWSNTGIEVPYIGIKGDKGDKGDKGTDGVGIASVVQTKTSAEDGGENEVTVTKTDGTASVIRVLNGKTGAQGPQGDSFQPIEDASGLVLAHVLGGDNTKAMSQKGVLDALDERTEYITYTWTKDDIDNDWTLKQPIDPETGVITSTTSNQSARYKRFDAYLGQRIRIVPNGDNVAMVAFLKGWPGSSPVGKTPNYCEGTSLFYVGPQIYEGTVPSDCVYLHIAYQYGSDDVITPSSVDIVASDVKGKISELENADRAISDSVSELAENLDDAIGAVNEKIEYIDKSWAKSEIDGSALTWPIDPEADQFVPTSTSGAPYRRGRRISNVSEYRGKRVRIVPNGDNVALVAFLKSWPTASGQDADYCEDTSLISVGTIYETFVPDDCTDMYVAYQWDSPTNTGNVITPSSIDIVVDVIDKISDLDHLTDDFTINALSLTGEDVGASGQQCGLISTAGGVHTFSSGTNGRLFPMTSYRGKTIQIVANPDYRTRFAFLKSFESGTGKPVYYCDGITSFFEIVKGNSMEKTIPSDCAYLYVENYYSSHYAAPESILITESITEKVASLSDNKPDLIYLSEDGDDENDGTTPSKAKATFAAALNAGSKNMQVVLLSDIHEGVDLNVWNGLKQHVTIRGGSNTRSRIIVGQPLEGLVAYSGYSDVYAYTPGEGETLSIGQYLYLWQHDLEDSSTLISDAYRHPLQKGRQYRSLSTKMKHASSLDDLLTGTSPSWYVESNVLYVRVAAGSNVESHPVYVPVLNNHALKAGDFDLTLSNIECWYGCIFVGQTSGNSSYLFKAVDCAARYSCGAGAWRLDDAISSHLERCEADGSTMSTQTTGDGFNFHPSLGTEDIYARGSTHTLIDCWSHDNRDDGYSDHGRSEGTIIGGLFEYNGKGGIVPSYGSHDTIYNATVRQNVHGVFNCGNASDGGIGTQTVCFGCVAISNSYNYTSSQGTADNKNKLILNGCISRNAKIAAIYATDYSEVVVRDCTNYGNKDTTRTDGNGIITIDNGTIITE